MIKKPLKQFLLILGISLIGFIISAVLHNFFYALSVVTKDISTLKFIYEVLHGTFFLIGVVGYPLVVIGTFIYTLYSIYQNHRQASKR